MEPAGLAVGIVGLVGLFNTCLDILDKFDSWRDYGSESRSLTAQFKAHKIQLERWGQAVGLGKDGLLDQHDRLLDDPQTLSTVKELLSAIRDICRYDDDALSEPKSVLKGHAHSRVPLESKRQKLSWALRDKAKRITQVEQFSSIVQTLHALIPTKGDHPGKVSKYPGPDGGNKVPGQLNAAFLVPGGCIAEFQRVLHRIEREIQAETKRDLQTWLLGSHLPNDRYEQYLENRMPRTCEWILDRHWFQDWSSPSFPNGHAKVLWVNGPAGFGKSVLCAKVIDWMSSVPDTPVAHFFFSSDIEREDPYVAIRSWVAQMMSHPTAFSLVRERWVAQERQKATRGDVIHLLREILMSIPGCTFFIDGLDECIWHKGNQTASDGDQVPVFMETLMRATANAASRLMITSRDEPEVRTCLPDKTYGAMLFEHKITPDDVRPDVLSYSQKLVNDELRKSTDTAKQSLSQKLASRCNGQFLWVKLQQKSLRRNSWKSHRELERVINSTPIGLEDIYERNWMKILKLPEEDRTRALSLLRWAAFSLRPLTVAEMTEALLISEDSDEVRTDQLPEHIDINYIDNGISFYCGSLLDIRRPQIDCDDGRKTVHLAHFSVKQYLLHNFSTDPRFLRLSLSPGSFTEPFENMLLSKMCLRYLNSAEVLQEHLKDEKVLGAFFAYAADSWHQHSSFSDPRDASVVKLVNQLFDTDRPNWMQWRKWFDSHDETSSKRRMNSYENSASPIYYAARLGLLDTVKFLIQNRKHNIEEKGILGRTALITACEEGQLQIAQFLIENGADINISDDDGWTPAIVATSNGHLDVFRLLLNNGADIEIADNNGWTPTIVASSNGHLDMVKVLLESRANIGVRNKKGWTPIIVAAANGHIELLKLLLDHGANINDADYRGWTLLAMAASKGHFEMVKLLLAHGVSISVANNNGRTPLHVASSMGHFDMAKLLLANGACVNSADMKGSTPIIMASSNGHVDLVRLLLESGSNINVSNREGWTPAIVASSNGYLDVVRLLLYNGANINITDTRTRAPLHFASSIGHSDVVELLINNGAHRNSTDDKGSAPIMLSSTNGHSDITSLLLEHGVNVDITDNDGRTSLIMAASLGYLDVARLLLDKGADINVADKTGGTPLHFAATDDHPSTAEFLLDYGAKTSVVDQGGYTPLHCASELGRLEVARQLLRSSEASLEIPDSTDRTPLFLAAARGHSQIIQLLISCGARTDLKDRYNTSALCAAIRNGHEQAVKLLISSELAPIDIEDGLGHNIVWWATRTGNFKIVELVRQWTKRMGIEVMDSDFSVKCTLVLPMQSSRSCDICTRLILSDCAYYRCTICYDFDICLECYEAGFECFDSSHEWAFRSLDNSV